jgi:flagellar basal body-associated protein FliL
LKFLENIIDKINDKILLLFEKIKGMTPQFFFDGIDWIKHLPQLLAKQKKVLIPKLTIYKLKMIGYTQHYIQLIQGNITSVLIYIRSEEFKKDKKKALVTNPINYIKNNTLQVSLVTTSLITFSFATYFISINASKIFSGSKSRAPASSHEAEVIDDTIFEIKHHKFEVMVAEGAGGGHGGGGGGHEEEIVSADIKIKTNDRSSVAKLEEMEEMIDDFLEAMEIKAAGLPFSEEEKHKLEEKIKLDLNEGLKLFSHETPIVKVELDFHLHGRPDYYRMQARSYTMQDVDLQVFEEDLNRNHQVYLDFTLIASNRNIVLYLKDNEMKIRDRLSTNVEPILPRLPVEDEGKRIIKDKIRDEINDILKEEKIEGKIQDVYLNFSMSS